MRYHRTFGLNAEQLDELEERIEDILAEPWDKGIGRPKSLSLREAIMVALLYKRQNMIEEVIADLFGVSQGTVSDIITEFTPLIAQATEEFRPDVEEAKQMTRGRLALVDGTLWPCWSWENAPELWAGKYKTTGHGSLIISDESGNIIFVSDPAPGCDHDMKKLEGEVKEILDLAGSVIADKGFQGSGYVTPAKKPKGRELYMREHEYNNQVSSIRAPIERAVAHLKTWKILFTDYRRPLNTFLDSFRAAIGLYFFELSFRFFHVLPSRHAGIPGCQPEHRGHQTPAGGRRAVLGKPGNWRIWCGATGQGPLHLIHEGGLAAFCPTAALQPGPTRRPKRRYVRQIMKPNDPGSTTPATASPVAGSGRRLPSIPELGMPALAEQGGAGREPQAQGDPDAGQTQPVEAQDQRGHRNVGSDGQDHRAAHGDVVAEAEDEAVQDERQRGQSSAAPPRARSSAPTAGARPAAGR